MQNIISLFVFAQYFVHSVYIHITVWHKMMHVMNIYKWIVSRESRSLHQELCTCDTVAAYVERSNHSLNRDAVYVGVSQQCRALDLLCSLLYGSVWMFLASLYVWSCDIHSFCVIFSSGCGVLFLDTLQKSLLLNVWDEYFELRLCFFCIEVSLLNKTLSCWCCRTSHRCHWIKSEPVTRLLFSFLFFPWSEICNISAISVCFLWGRCNLMARRLETTTVTWINHIARNMKERLV